MLRAFTDDPKGLLAKIEKEIKAGNIDTWKFTTGAIPRLDYLAAQWQGMACFQIRIDSDEPATLKFLFRIPERENYDQYTYAVYHSDLAQMLMAHFSDLAHEIRIYPKPQR